MNETQVPRSRHQRRKRAARSTAHIERTLASLSGVEGGRYAPLSTAQQVQIDIAVRELLEHTGLAEAPDIVIEKVTAKGGKLKSDGRLIFSNALIDEALAGFRRNFTLHGQIPGHELNMSGAKVHVGSGGAAPQVVDLETGIYRASNLKDLYDAARLVDGLENIHFFSRSLVAGDMPNELLLDINTAYACLSGTRKHVFTAVTLPEHVETLAGMCFVIAGSPESFAERPFLSVNINHVVPPMRFAAGACEVMAKAARLGIPIHANSFGQLGASSPVTLAGSIVQNVTETLAGMIFAWSVNPDARVTFGVRPMITDLRTGAMSGGSGEQALLMAAAIQMAQYYDLPNTCIAGATDSKIADAQSGYEKCLSVTLAAHAGSNAITQACGMQASLMGCALESYLIDNEMLGCILRSISPLEVNESTLCVKAIDEVVRGEGHFLGHSQTLERMQSDFLYPTLADRSTPEQWQENGSKDIRQQAREKTKQILASYFPDHINEQVDKLIRASMDIRLPRKIMGEQ